MASIYPIAAMQEANIGVAAICMSKWYVVLESGLQLPIVEFLDEDRQPCPEGEEACYYEFGTEEIGYAIGSFAAYDMPSYEDH
jgi:hypothetical protein